MSQKIKKQLRVLTLLCLVGQTLAAQSKVGAESYHFIRQRESMVWMPVVNYESGKGLFAELRYNYEDLHTITLFGGKSFELGAKKNTSLIPMVGLSAGDFKGVSIGTKIESEPGNWFFSAESQYSISFRKDYPGFFYNWSEAGYNICKYFFAGLSVQYTYLEKTGLFEPGLLAGLTYKNFALPVYVFNPFRNDHYVVIGLNIDFDFKK